MIQGLWLLEKRLYVGDMSYIMRLLWPGNESRCDMLQILDKVEEKYFASDATVAPGGWCCWCWCCKLPSGHDVMKS